MAEAVNVGPNKVHMYAGAVGLLQPTPTTNRHRL